MTVDDPVAPFAKESLIRVSDLLALLMPLQAGVGIGIKDLAGRYQVANKALETLLGKGAGQIVGATDAELVAPGVARQLAHSDQRIIAGAPTASDEFELEGDDQCSSGAAPGEPVHCHWLKFPVLGTDGKTLSIGSVLIDARQHRELGEMRQSLSHLQQTNQQLQSNVAELDRLASTDPLTGAWNRRRLEETVTNEMDRLRRYDHPLSLLLLDIDFFKKINDTHGHLAGDRVLAELAALIKSTLRATDSLTRWGGEEFVVLSPNTTAATMAILAERLRERIARSEFLTVGALTVSIGVAECLPGELWTPWVARADAALYRAKACGRNQVDIAPETLGRAGASEKVTAGFLQLSWHAAYECGEALIDAQHRALFAHANALLTATLDACPNDEIIPLVDALVADVVVHFRDEEAIFTAAGYPDASEHAAIHSDLVNHASELVARFHAGSLALGELFEFLAHDVVARHMLGADRKFFPYVGNGSGSRTAFSVN
ncbi:MAG: diguanylate cyclase [Propionivibrio sp.]